MTPEIQPSRRTLALLVLVAGALALRLYGVGFGLPHLYYWDEPTVVNRAVRFGSGDLDPHFHTYPALYMYAMFAVSGVYFAASRVLGHFHGVQDFAVEYFTDPSNTYLAARVATAAVGALAVLVTFAVGRRFFGTRSGLLGALFLSVSVLHASYSHVAVTDVAHSLFITAAFLPIHRILSGGRRRDYVLAGALIGLGMATKYLAVLAAPSLVLAHCCARDHGLALGARVRRALLGPHRGDLLVAAAAALAAFAAGSPYTFIRLPAFFDGFVDLRHQAARSFVGAEESPIAYYAMRVLPSDYGWPLAVVAGAALVRLALTRTALAWLFLSFPLAYLAFVSLLARGTGRYMIPEDPFVAILAASGVDAGLRALERRFPGRTTSTRLAALATVALLVTTPLVRILHWDASMARGSDTRSAAFDWVEREVPAGARVALQSMYDRTYFNVPVMTDKQLHEIERRLPEGDRFANVRARVREDLARHPLYREVAFRPDLDAMEHDGVDWVFTSDANRADDATAFARFEATLAASAKGIHVFTAPARDGWMRDCEPALAVVPPTIRIYALR